MLSQNLAEIPFAEQKKRIAQKDGLLVFLVLFLVFGQRFVIPLAGFPIPMLVFVVFGVFGIWVLRKRVVIVRRRLLFFYLAFFTILLSALISSYYSISFSLPSLVFLILIYIPVIFVHKQTNQIITAYDVFQNAMFLAAVIGILQFTTQLVGVEYRDYFEFIPQEFIVKDYNYSIPVQFGGSLYKANGIFFLEPSFYSQFLAVTLLIEIIYFRRYWRLVPLFTAFLFSFSGTGIVALAVGLLLYGLEMFRKLRLKNILFFALVLLVPLLAFFNSDFSEYTVSRVEEFNSPTASGFLRFIAPVLTVRDHVVVSDARTLLFGAGPGSVDDIGVAVEYGAHPVSFVKLLIDYGIFSFIMFYIFIINAFFDKTVVDFSLLISLFVIFNVLTGALHVPQPLYLCYLIGLLFIKGNNAT
jgi:hypothetical protein